jgi:hypothetical protein
MGKGERIEEGGGNPNNVYTFNKCKNDKRKRKKKIAFAVSQGSGKLCPYFQLNLGIS